MKSSRRPTKENVPPSVGKSRIPMARITAVHNKTPKKESSNSSHQSPPMAAIPRASSGPSKAMKREGSPSVMGVVSSSPPKVTRRQILGELPCEQRRILKVRKETGNKGAKLKTCDAKTVVKSPVIQQDIAFEKDDSALESILNDTGIQAASKSPVPVRHTMAAMGSHNKSLRPSIYGPPKKYGLEEFQRTCEEFIRRSSMIQPNVKRQRLAEQSKTDSAGFKFPSLRTTPRSQRCAPIPSRTGKTILESPVFKKQFILALTPTAQSRNTEGKSSVSCVETEETSLKTKCDPEKNGTMMGAKENANPTLQAISEDIPAKVKQSQSGLVFNRALHAHSMDIPVVSKQIQAGPSSSTTIQAKSGAANLATMCKPVPPGLGFIQGRPSEIGPHTPGRVLKCSVVTQQSNIVPHTPGRVLKQNLFPSGNVPTSSKISTSGFQRQSGIDVATCGNFSIVSNATGLERVSEIGLHTPMRVVKPMEKTSNPSRFSELGSHTPQRVAKTADSMRCLEIDQHTPARVAKPNEKQPNSVTFSETGPHTPARVARPTEVDQHTPLRVLAKIQDPAKTPKSPGRLLKQGLDAQYKHLSNDLTPRRELKSSVGAQYNSTHVKVDLTPIRQIKQEPGTSIGTAASRTPVTKEIIGQSMKKTLTWADTLSDYKTPFSSQSSPEHQNPAAAVFRFGAENEDTFAKTDFSFDSRNCSKRYIIGSGAGSDISEVGHESSKPGPENEESWPTREVASLQNAMQNDPPQEPRITSPLTSTQHTPSTQHASGTQHAPLPTSLPVIPAAADATGVLSRRVHQTLHSPTDHEYHGTVTQSACTAAEFVHESQGEMTQIDTYPCQGQLAARSEHFGNEQQLYQGQQSRNEQNDKLQRQIRLFEEKKQQLLELHFKIQQQMQDENLASLDQGLGHGTKHSNGNINIDFPTASMQHINNDKDLCDNSMQNYVDIANGNHVCLEGQMEVKATSQIPNVNSQGLELKDDCIQDVNSNVCFGNEASQASYTAYSVNSAKEAHSSKCNVAKVEKVTTPKRESKPADCDDVDITPFILRENNNNKPRWTDSVPSTNPQTAWSATKSMSLGAQGENQFDTYLFNPLPLPSNGKRDVPVKSPETVSLPIWTPLALKTVAKQLELKTGFANNSLKADTDTHVPPHVQQVSIETKLDTSQDIERRVLSIDKVPAELSIDTTTKLNADKLAGLGTDNKCDVYVGCKPQDCSTSPMFREVETEQSDLASSIFTATSIPKTPPSKSSAFHSVNRSSLTPTIGSLSLRANASNINKPKRKLDPLHKTLFREVNERYNEALLDDEVARYASRLVMESVGKRGRTCYNPVAKTLLEGDQMHFVPIMDDPMDDKTTYLLETSAFSRCTRST